MDITVCLDFFLYRFHVPHLLQSLCPVRHEMYVLCCPLTAYLDISHWFHKTWWNTFGYRGTKILKILSLEMRLKLLDRLQFVKIFFTSGHQKQTDWVYVVIHDSHGNCYRNCIVTTHGLGILASEWCYLNQILEMQ